MPPCDQPIPQKALKHIHVSILVLVDAALRHGDEAMQEIDVVSFNPCFSGCRPATLLCNMSLAVIA